MILHINTRLHDAFERLLLTDLRIDVCSEFDESSGSPWRKDKRALHDTLSRPHLYPHKIHDDTAEPFLFLSTRSCTISGPAFRKPLSLPILAFSHRLESKDTRSCFTSTHMKSFKFLSLLICLKMSPCAKNESHMRRFVDAVVHIKSYLTEKVVSGLLV
jgi:hypothetical protein